MFRLRYEVYSREMGRLQRFADDERRRIEEPEDESAIILAASNEAGEVVGTARIHLKENIPAPYVSLYSIESLGSYHPAATSTVTKLMVAAAYRGTTLGVRLAQACYRVGLAADVSFNFIDCSPGVRAFFDQLGYLQLFPDVEHPEYGTVSPLVLAMHDREHLRKTGSPLQCPHLVPEHPSVSYFRDRFAQFSRATQR